MKDLKETKIFKDKDVLKSIENEYRKALKDEEFNKFVSRIKLSHDELMKYTSRLETCVSENRNCLNCSGLNECKNEIYGFKLTPTANKNKLTFNYIACRYKEVELKEKNDNIYLFDIPKDIANARMKDIYVTDKNRKDTIIWLKNFVKGYDINNPSKGLYLHGNFGCGKTYLIVAALNELSKRDINSAVIYWPEFLRDLKASFEDDFKEKFNFIKRVPLLLIDDIGAENLTPWARDEILASILQYRMESHLTTFFTSNLNLEELESHLSMTKGNVDLLKAKRIIERIKKLTEDLEMNAENLRK
jgi:primosomal protein DnaI